MASHILYMRDTDKTAGIGVRTTAYIEATYGATGITFQTLHTVREGDTLFIVGHGSAKKMTVSGHSPSELATVLTKHGLSKPVNIFLFSCHTGFSGAPYALELKLELVQKKVLCSVQAPTAQISSKGRIRDSTAKTKKYMTGNLLVPDQPSWATNE